AAWAVGAGLARQQAGRRPVHRAPSRFGAGLSAARLGLRRPAAALQRRFSRLCDLRLQRQRRPRGLAFTPHYTSPVMRHRRRELVDAQAGVYRYDRLAVLERTRMPAVLLEAGSIINRTEELELATPERRDLISGAVVAAVTEFCASRTVARQHHLVRRVAAPAASIRRRVGSR